MDLTGSFLLKKKEATVLDLGLSGLELMAGWLLVGYVTLASLLCLSEFS